MRWRLAVAAVQVGVLAVAASVHAKPPTLGSARSAEDVPAFHGAGKVRPATIGGGNTCAGLVGKRWGRRQAEATGSICVVADAAASAAAVLPDVMVSLGDSYSSGEGSRDKVNPNWDRPTHSGPGGNGCHRGPNAWPRLLTVTARRHFACSGARIDDVIRRGQKSRAPDDVAQLTRLADLDATVDIDVVLLTIGGNDLGFASKIRACYLGRRCLGDLDKLDRELEELEPRLVDAYSRFADATRGDLVVVGYPDIFPSRSERHTFHACSWLGENPERGIAERTGIWHLQNGLHRTIKRAAADAGVAFVPIRDALDEHEMCTRKSYVNKITLTGSDRVHPKARGQKLMADAVRKHLERIYADATPAAAPRWRNCGACRSSTGPARARLRA